MLLRAIAICLLAVSAQASEADNADRLLQNAIGLNFDVADHSRYFSVSFERQFDSAWYGWFELAQEELEFEQFDSTRSYSVQLLRELAYPWLASLYVSHWDGADAVETAVYELQLDRVFERAQLGLFVGQQKNRLTGERSSGNSIERDFASQLFGLDVRYYPVNTLELSARFSYYSHDFNADALNVTDRPALTLLLSPDSFGVIDGLDNWSLLLNSSIVHDSWLWGAQLGLSESAVEELSTVAVSAFSEYELTPALSISGEITQQRTDNFDSSEQVGIGARFSF